MESIKEFLESVKKEEAAVLATSAGSEVTMRMVSPVFCEDGVLIFTSSQSCKYRQLQENPNCCLAVGTYFLQTRAEFMGPTMQDDNEALRSIYSEKFPDAFEIDTEFGGKKADFVMLKPVKLAGWSFETGAPVFVCLE